MYLKSRNILNFSCENRLYRVSNEKSIIDYIKEFFKKIIEYIKKFIDKIKSFFSVKRKQVSTKIETVKVKVDKLEIKEVHETVSYKTKSASEITTSDILAYSLDYKIDDNTVNKIKDFVKYKFQCGLAPYVIKSLEQWGLDSMTNINVVADIRKISVPEIAKNICKLGKVSFDKACLTFSSSGEVFYYDYDMLKGEFKKIDADEINIDKKVSDITVNISNLQKVVDELNNFYKTTVIQFEDKLNKDLDKLVLTLNKLKDNINKDYAGSVDLNDKLKPVGNLSTFSTKNVTDIRNNVDNFISGAINIITDIIK